MGKYNFKKKSSFRHPNALLKKDEFISSSDHVYTLSIINAGYRCGLYTNYLNKRLRYESVHQLLFQPLKDKI
jgi:hypothetical protein